MMGISEVMYSVDYGSRFELFEELLRIQNYAVMLEQQLEDEKLRHSETLNLLMQGEALRQNMMIQTILAGGFSTPVHK
jgi:hypothetical protein